MSTIFRLEQDLFRYNKANRFIFQLQKQEKNYLHIQDKQNRNKRNLEFF